MQKNDLALKRKILIDGVNVPGLVSTSELTDSEEPVDVASFGRKTEIKSGVKKLNAIDLTYKIARDTDTQQVFNDWYFNDEYHDVTVVNTDATGQEVDRWLLRDCECKKYSEQAYDAGSVKFFGLDVSISCTTTPVRVQS